MFRMRTRGSFFGRRRITTIAYAAGVMAADSQATSGPRKFRVKKIQRVPGGGLLGITGSMPDLLKIQKWAADGFPQDAKPDLSDDGDVECLLVHADGSIALFDSSLELMAVQDKFIAIGSGGPYAVAAMACGLDPVQAVGIAARFDPYTSAPVKSERLKK